MPTYTLDLVDSEPRLQQLWQLDQGEYQDNNLTFQAFRAWWSRYDLGLRIVTNSQSAIVGAVGIWGLDVPTVRAFIGGQISESSLAPMTVADMEANPTQYWYFSGIISVASLKKTFGSPLRRLLHGGIGGWVTSSHLKFPVHCYALGYSGEGKTLLDRFGFEVIKQSWEMPDQLPLYWRQFNSAAEFRQAIK